MIRKGCVAINLRLGWKGGIVAGLIVVGASWGQPVERVALEDLIARCQGRDRADLRLVDDGAPLLDFYDERGVLRAGYSLSEGRAGSLAFYDETGEPCAGLGGGQTGAMRLGFLDAAGHVL